MAQALIIQLIADYGVGDPAFAEVVQKLTYLDRSVLVHEMSVPKFSTIATGIWIAQFATVNAYTGLIIYSNTAPRTEDSKVNQQTLGGNFAYTKLDNGVIVMAVHVGYCFSFIKPLIKSLHHVNVSTEGSQFRSRDYFPYAVMGVAHGDNKYIGESIEVSSIPEPPSNLIGFVDGYGNLKTTMRKSHSTFVPGTKVNITCNEVTKSGVVADETYHVKDGDISFAPGSTGGDDRFMEIWVRGASAWEAFGKPKVEQEFKIEP